jgi:deoxynucleoside triphosphate triphosphohydrolase SAMHD1
MEDISLSQHYADAYNDNDIHRSNGVGPTSYPGLLLHGAGNGAATARDDDPAAHLPGKLFNDPIHGAFRLCGAAIQVIDTPQFQRLRRLKQLGLNYLIFPGASHNRFEHSLGVAHLASKFSHQIWRSHAPEDVGQLRPRDLRIVELAGLCHDLGHGPFSHVFERQFLQERCGVVGWHHEDMSAKMLDHIIDSNNLDTEKFFPEDDVRRIKAMITAGHGAQADDGFQSHGSNANDGPRWLTEVVANGRSGIDVDKFDYLARDSAYSGVKVACDFSRIMQFARVIDDEICKYYTHIFSLVLLSYNVFLHQLRFE